jgi:hypothetical protein
MTEEQAIRWLFQNNTFSKHFLENFITDTTAIRPYFGVTNPFVTGGKKPGDIDLMLVDPMRPDRTMAFECKRVKATSLCKDYSTVNNANGIRKGVLQANALQSLGFHRSYLMIILLDDGRELDYPNTMMRRSTSNNVEDIYEIPFNEKIHDDVGVVYVKVTQPTGKHFDLMGGTGVCIDKEAGRLDQSSEMTSKVVSFLRGLKV